MQRILVMGILDERLTAVVRDYRRRLSSLTGNQLALRFPVHVTLRGPFWTETDAGALGDFVHGICKDSRMVSIVLDGLAFVDPGLCWLPVKLQTEGAAALYAMHRRLDRELAPHVVRDDVPPDHKGRNYRPHVTLGWGVDASVCGNQPLFSDCDGLTGTLHGVAVGSYPDDWPDRGDVEIISSMRLGPALPDPHQR